MKTVTIVPHHRFPADHDEGPHVIIDWVQPNPNVWEGKIRYCLAGKSWDHDIRLCMGMPIGTITILLNALGYGCFAMASVPACAITGHDLVWAANWALAALRGHPLHDMDAPEANE